MKHPFIPDLMADDVYQITPDMLRDRGLRVALLDVDNTLVTYGMAEPTDAVVSWISSLRAAGIDVAIASNNHADRVARFNEKLGVFTVSESRKPSRRAVRAVCREFQAAPGEIAVIGDQIFTDVWCARRARAYAILVKPIPYPENLFFKCKRALEKPFIRAYRRRARRASEKGEFAP